MQSLHITPGPVKNRIIEDIIKMKSVLTPNAPLPVGPYSQAIIEAPFIFCSGQIPMDPATSVLASPDIRLQTMQALENLKAVLEAAGSSFGKVVKTTVYLKNMSEFSACNEVYASFFSEPFPARSCLQVAALPKNALVEIEAIARV